MELSISAMTRRRLLQGAVALFSALGSSHAGYAATTPEQDAKALVTRLVKQILEAIDADSGDSSQERRMMAVIERETNLNLLARMTLGRYWRQATVQQRKVFADVFRRYLLQSFTSRLRRYAGTGLGAVHDRFTIVATKKVGKNDVVVRSLIKPPSGASLEVDWRIRSRDGHFFIIDLVVEGISLLITQRSEFGSVVERIGVDGLIGELETRVARQT
ncbi:MAG: MlaC/ttg2D family ABC transporter substrate-binding protein [Geminicoccaceae bacterium]